MLPAHPDADDAAALDALRRRLYGPDATERDLAEYREALAARPAAAREPAPAEPVRRPLPRTPLLLAAAAVLALAAVVVGTRPAPAPSPAAAPAGLAVPAGVRAAFVRNLDRGRDAGVADYFFRHPDARPAELRTLQRAATEEHDGTGSQAVLLEPSAAADRGGRLTVALTLARGGRAAWRAVRTAERTDHSPYLQEVARRGGAQAAGWTVSTTVRYEGEAPARLLVAAPRGVRWDVVVVFSD